MPLFRPTIHSGSLVKLSPSDKHRCGSCPDAWFHIGFDTENTGGRQGVYVELDDGSFRWVAMDAARAATQYPIDRIYEVGRDGYYLTMEQARRALADGVHGIHYVDDFNDEYQDIYVCGEGPNTPYAEATVPEPIR